MDVLQVTEEEDPTLLTEARERRRKGKASGRPLRMKKTAARKKPEEEDIPTDFGGVSPFPTHLGSGFPGYGSAPLPSVALGGSVFSSMTGMLPMGMGAGMPRTGYGYGH